MSSAKTDVNRRQEAAELLASHMYTHHHCHWRKCHHILEEVRSIKQSDPQKTRLKVLTVK